MLKPLKKNSNQVNKMTKLINYYLNLKFQVEGI